MGSNSKCLGEAGVWDGDGDGDGDLGGGGRRTCVSPV